MKLFHCLLAVALLPAVVQAQNQLPPGTQAPDSVAPHPKGKRPKAR